MYRRQLLNQAGDFMRELDQHGMCIGMMANSGAERRHEYGRRAAKKAVAGGCWRTKVPALAETKNLLAFLTLREILIWQHGTDLVSHERALRQAMGAKRGACPVVQSRRTVNHERLSAATSDAAAENEWKKEELEMERALEEDADNSGKFESKPDLREVGF